MIIRRKDRFIRGAVMALIFLCILYAMYLPLFDGKNTLQASDDLFNSISKGSSYYIPALKTKNTKNETKQFSIELKSISPETITKYADALTKTGITLSQDNTISGSLGKLINTMLDDADAMFNNNNDTLKNKYGADGKEVLYTWWLLLKDMTKEFNKQSKFEEAKFANEIKNKAVELAYNYYGIIPQDASSKMAILITSIVFYVAYTLWWGFAILYLFEGIGLMMVAGKKKEV
ncbi:hypothetical protein MCHI_001256 [Candidatus Magnetoovum chiemensis]|nr:hypothetical protein MCHI_001256 [Candidatus Magnetoovum chiemensis]